MVYYSPYSVNRMNASSMPFFSYQHINSLYYYYRGFIKSILFICYNKSCVWGGLLINGLHEKIICKEESA